MPNDIITVSELPDPNCTYTVTCNGVEYECVPTPGHGNFGQALCYLGNGHLYDQHQSDTREPFLILFTYNESAVVLEFNFKDSSIDNTISIDKVTTSVKPLDAVLSKRIINLAENPYILYYCNGDISYYANIDANLSVTDLVNSIVTSGTSGAENIGGIYSNVNRMITMESWDGTYIYNPYSGYIAQKTNSDAESNAYDISSTVEIQNQQDLLNSTLQFEDGDPVICSYISYNQADNVVALVAAEPVLKDSSGNIIHDFTVGPIIYNMNTHEFIYGDTSWGSQE